MFPASKLNSVVSTVIYGSAPYCVTAIVPITVLPNLTVTVPVLSSTDVFSETIILFVFEPLLGLPDVALKEIQSESVDAVQSFPVLIVNDFSLA